MNAFIWKVFVELYGADSEVKLNGKDINSYINPETKVEVDDIIFQIFNILKVELREEDMKVLNELKDLIKFDQSENK